MIDMWSSSKGKDILGGMRVVTRKSSKEDVGVESLQTTTTQREGIVMTWEQLDDLAALERALGRALAVGGEGFVPSPSWLHNEVAAALVAGNTCHATAPSSGSCCRVVGHGGQHVLTYGRGGKVRAVWPNESAEGNWFVVEKE